MDDWNKSVEHRSYVWSAGETMAEGAEETEEGLAKVTEVPLRGW